MFKSKITGKTTKSHGGTQNFNFKLKIKKSKIARKKTHDHTKTKFHAAYGRDLQLSAFCSISKEAPFLVTVSGSIEP